MGSMYLHCTQPLDTGADARMYMITCRERDEDGIPLNVREYRFPEVVTSVRLPAKYVHMAI